MNSRFEYQDGDNKIIMHLWSERLHRGDGPAKITINEKGVRIRETFFINGKRHNEYGPAVIIRNGDGIIIERQWWILGTKLATLPKTIFKKGAI